MEWFRGGRRALILASVFGCATAAHANSDAGFEEWGLLQQATVNEIASVPEPGAMLLVGTGLLLAARRLKKTS